MKLNKKFKFLSMQLQKRKEKESYFLVLNVLDENNTPSKFLAFDDDVIQRVTSATFQGLQDIAIDFDLTYSGTNWNVHLNDVTPVK